MLYTLKIFEIGISIPCPCRPVQISDMLSAFRQLTGRLTPQTCSFHFPTAEPFCLVALAECLHARKQGNEIDLVLPLLDYECFELAANVRLWPNILTVV